MDQKITFWCFLGAVIVVGIYFLRIVQPFVLPLLLAGTLALLVQPLFLRVVPLVRGYRRLAAVLVTVLVVLLVVIPVLITLGLATQELIEYGGQVVREVQRQEDGALEATVRQLKAKLSSDEFERLTRAVLNGDAPRAANSADAETRQLVQALSDFNAKDVEHSMRANSSAAFLDPDSIPVLNRILEWLSPYVTKSDLNDVRDTALEMGRTLLSNVYEKTTALISDLISFVIGFAVMILALYYFLAEGKSIAVELDSLLPLEPRDEEAVARQFETICRGVVWGTLVAAVAQGVLLGGVLAILQIPGAWLLTCLTVVTAMIPFVGSAGVYVPVALFLLWSERYGSGIFLLAYGAVVVSTVDNLIRAHMIHGASRLHPLVALISALGALQLVGLWGIFVGPVVAGIFYAMLKILRRKLGHVESGRDQPAATAPI